MKTNLLSRLVQAGLGVLASGLCMSNFAGAASFDLQFVNGVAVPGGGTCGLTLNSRCRFNNVVVGAGTGSGNPFQRDVIITLTRLNDATLTNVFDNTTPILSATPVPAASQAQFFAPTVTPTQSAAGLTSWAEFTFDFVSPGGAAPLAGAGTATLPGSFWVTSFDTDGDSGTLREFVEFVGIPAADTDLSSGTALSSSIAVDGGVQYQSSTNVQSDISTSDVHKASAVFSNKSSFKLIYGARTGTSGTSAGGRLTVFDFFKPDAVLLRSAVDGYKSVKLTMDADTSGTVTAGDTLTWTITYVNTGNAAVSNFQITDTLPGNVTFTPGSQVVTSGTGSTAVKRNGYNGSGNLLTNTGVLGANSSITVSISVVVAVDATNTTLGNQASAGGVLTDNVDSDTVYPPLVKAASGFVAAPAESVTQTEVDNSAGPTTVAVVNANADLAITKTDNVTSVISGNATTYTIRVTNNGPSSVTGAVLKDPAATGLNQTGAACSAASNNKCTAAPTIAALQSASGVILPALASGAFYEFTVTATVTAASGSVTNTASVAVPSGTADPVSSNNSASDTDTVTPLALAPGVSKSFSPTNVTPGSSTQLTITVTNPNGIAATSFSLIDDIAGTTGITGLTITTVNSDTCKSGGTVTITSGRYALMGGTLPAGGCSVVLNLQLPGTISSGTKTNTILGTSVTGVVNGQPLPAAANAVATLSVTASPPAPAVQPGIWSNATCLDFTGVSLNVNSPLFTKSIPTPEGVVVTYVIDVTTNALLNGGAVANGSIENVLQGYTPGTWAGDNWDEYFAPTTNKMNALVNESANRKVGYILTVYATFDGQSIPITLLTGSAEDDGATEYVKTNTNGTPFAVADRSVGNSRFGDVIVSNLGKTVQMSVNSATGNFLLTATTKIDATEASPLVLTSEIAGSGKTAQGFCVTFPYDRGDAPLTYAKAAHLQNLTFSSPLTDRAKTDLNNGAFASSSSVSSTTAYLGNQPSSENTERGATGTGDTDDGVTSLPSLNSSATSYSVPVAYTNTSGVAATLAGWVDFNGNGVFEAGERAFTTVGVGSGTATLTWNGVTISGGTTISRYARFRISTDGTGLSSPFGNVRNGEVEDYIVQLVGAKLTKTVTNLSVVPNVTGTTVAGKPGDSLEYCIAFSNTGNASLPNFTVTDSVPGNTTGQVAAYGPGQGVKITRGAAPDTYQAFANPVSVNLGTLVVGESGSICFTAKIN